MLSVEVGDRPEDLVDALVAYLATPLDDPFQAEWVSVPTLGFRSWLRFRLAERLGAGPDADGIAANIDMPFPGALRRQILAAHAQQHGLSEQPDPWRPESLVWSLMEVMASRGERIDPRLGRAGLPPGVSLAARAGPIADLFDRYGVHRPEMVQAWADGSDVGPDGTSPLPSDRAWQPHLYRALRDHVTRRHPELVPPAERLAAALEEARLGGLPLSGGPDGLPPRLFLVGQSIIGADLGPVVDALATQLDVRVLLLSPSAATTRRVAANVAAQQPATSSSSWARPRAEVEEHLGEGHPLVHAWGARTLDSALLLGAGGVIPDLLPAASTSPTTLLAHVQSEMRRDVSAGGAWADGLDDSLQVHAAPGRARQVEVLRDVILGLLRDHPDLDEGDVAILCPQLEAFGPVLSSVLGPSARRGEQPRSGAVPALRYTVIDRTARAGNPVLDAMAAVIDAVAGRFDSGTVRDILHAPAVRERFGLTTDDLGFVSEAIEATAVRWGLDGPHRAPWGIDPSHHANSWAAGVDQILMGVALGDALRDAAVPGSSEVPHPVARHALAVGGVAPMPLDEGAISSAGRVAHALRTLAHVHDLLTEPSSRPIEAWVEALAAAADLLVAAPRFEDWQRSRFDVLLAEVVAASADGVDRPSSLPVSLSDVRRLLAPGFDTTRPRVDLGHGSVVVAHPSLMAGIPFRVVCVLGLDDGALPVGSASGDDVTALTPYVGDADVRSEARSAILAAVGAARDHLVVTCTSRDVRTNAVVPRSVVLDELLETITAALPPDAGPIVREHPRQAFDARELDDGPGRTPFGFDPSALAGAKAITARPARVEAARGVDLLLVEPLDDLDDEPGVDLADLRSFYAHPVRAFFRRRLQVVIPSTSEAGDDQLPTLLTPLEESQIGAELIDVGLVLGDPEAIKVQDSGAFDPMVQSVFTALEARGTLPPPAVAGPTLARLADEVAILLGLAADHGVTGAPQANHEVSVELPAGTSLTGSVRAGPTGTEDVRFARFKPKYLVTASIDLLALTAMRPDLDWQLTLVTRGKKKGSAPEAFARRVTGVDPDERRQAALDALDVLVAQWRDGMRYPLPLFDNTSYDLIHGPRGGEGAWGQLESVGFSFSAECLDPHHQLAFGAIRYDDLVALTAGGHSLTGEARRLWGALDTALDVVDQASA